MRIHIIVKNDSCHRKIHHQGQEIIMGPDTLPEGICIDAWNCIAPYVTTMRFGGDFPWEKEKGILHIRCPDPSGTLFKLIREDEEGDESIFLKDVQGKCFR